MAAAAAIVGLRTGNQHMKNHSMHQGSSGVGHTLLPSVNNAPL